MNLSLLRNWIVIVFVTICASAVAQLQRVPNTTLTMPSAPPTYGYTYANAFSGLIFTNPICIVSPPGETNRLLILSKNGLISVITNLAQPTGAKFMDLTPQVSSQSANSGTAGERGLLGLAFHPGFATNGFFYVLYMSDTGSGTYYDNLSRFKISSTNPNQGDTNSQVFIYRQVDRDPNHNSGDIHFGADGYLYITVGDEGAEHDGRNCAQIITNALFSGMLRIDVDKRAGNLTPNPAPSSLTTFGNYLIPADNPFIGVSSFDGIAINPNMVRTEFYAVGLRNAWRWNFDFYTNAFGTNVLYLGDVGQDHYEEVDVVQKGDNLGWAYWEGTNVSSGSDLPHDTYVPTSGTNIKFPIVRYAHTGDGGPGNCVIGGAVYRGSNLPQLYGDYVYADYVSGDIWTLVASNYTAGSTNVNGASGPTSPIISDSSLDITAFGTDPRNGDVLFCATKNSGYATAATIDKIIYNNVTNGAPLPATLYDTGAFTNLFSLTSAQDSLLPASGILPYTINVPFWSDNAIKSRWFSIPNANSTMDFNANGNWNFPTGMVWIKNFNLELTNGDPTSTIRLETRFIIKNSSGVYGATYIWNSKTNAVLAPTAGMDTNFVISDGGIIRTQTWHFPSQQECQTCHTAAGGFGLGFRTEQLNDTMDYGFGLTNEIQALSAAGYFSSLVTNNPSTLLALATATNTAYSLEFRARSFLQANCAQCHQPQGTAQQSSWDARVTTPTALAGLINGALANNLGNVNNHVITPNSPTNSVLLTRDAARDLGSGSSIQMPPLDSYLTDIDATNVVTQWILSMTNQFWIGASPDPQTIQPGNNAAYTVNFVNISDFSSDVALSVSNLPPGANADFSPATVNSTVTNSTLTVSTSLSTPDGDYILTITGIGGGVTNSDTITLSVENQIMFGNPGTMLWTHSGSDDNWVTSVNWTNLTAGGYGPPSTNNDLIFNNAAAGGTNYLNYNATVNSLNYQQTNGIHHTVIPAGTTLIIHGSAANYGLVDGTAGTPNVLINATNIITGGGTINLDNAGDIEVEQGAAQVDAHNVVLDLSGLNTLIVNGSAQGYIAVGGGGYNGTSRTRASGTLFMAKTNLIYMKYNFRIGDNDTANSPNLCAIYLGQSNSIVLGNNNDDFSTGFSGNTNLLAFAPGLVNPALYVRSEYSGTAPRVPTWYVANSGRLPCVATNDFSGGVIDVMASDLRIGRAASGANPALGVLTFDGGTFDANTIEDGWQTVSAGGTGVGIINVKSNSASGTRGTLVVNTSLTLGDLSGTLTSGTAGTLNIAGGIVQANSIVTGGGASTITMNGGVLIPTNAVGSAAAPIGNVSLANSTLHLSLNGNAIGTNIFAASLVASGVNTISIDSAVNVTTAKTFPLISYNSFSGSVAANFVKGTLPNGFVASLVDNSAQHRIDLVIAASTNATPHFGASTISGSNLIFAGSNGLPNGIYYVLASTNVALPLNLWTPVSTNPFDANGNFNFTNGMSTNSQLFYLLQLP